MKNHKIKRRMPTLNTYKSHLFGKLFSDKQVYNFLRTIVACQKRQENMMQSVPQPFVGLANLW